MCERARGAVRDQETMGDYAVRLRNLGKMYKLFRHPADKVVDAFGLGRWLFWRKMEYREFWALRSLNLEVRQGERVGIIGQNGAGKSTLLKIISGNITPTEGTVDVAGRIQALLELGTGFHPEFTGRENIRASLALNGMSATQIHDKMEEIVDFAELEDFIDQPLKTYSAGMYARLAFSTATAVLPEILIIDEVLGAGDAYFAGKCVERMKRLTHESGATVLFVSHDLASVQGLCDRVIWLRRGMIHRDGSPLHVVKAYYQMVQEEEAARQRAKAQGVPKRLLLAGQSRDRIQLTFHLVTPGGNPPRGRHLVRHIRLFHQDDLLGDVAVGAPMDDDTTHPLHLLTDSHYMDWSKSQRDGKGFCRCYVNQGGRYRHAPFIATLPPTLFRNENPRLRLEIEAETSSEDEVLVEYFWNDAYHTLGSLLPSRNLHAMEFPLETGTTEHGDSAAAPAPASLEEASVEIGPKPEPNEKSVVTWRDPDPCIVDLRFLNAQGKSVGGVMESEDLTVEISYYSSKVVENPVFAMTIYAPEGQIICHANTVLADTPISRILGRGRVCFHFSPFLVGRGDYVVSTSIFEYLDPWNYTGQPPYYDQHNRAYRLKVFPRPDLRLNLGFVQQSYAVEHSPVGG